MTDDELLRGFEDGTLDAHAFHHAEHVRLVWLHLRRHGRLDTLDRVSRGLRRLAARHGKPELYHETITWGWVLLIAQRLRATPDLTRDAFAKAHPDLLDRTAPALAAYYSPGLLASAEARRDFVLPDRVPV
ncbi:MAG: hypothetical protein R2991_07970 [Thermoanaerobaculia bacterium]